jgi:hypothetical protein
MAAPNYAIYFYLIRTRNQDDMIARAHLTVAETMEVGDEITKELKRNREKIESARNKVGGFFKMLIKT